MVKVGQSLKDTAFSVDRMFVWGVGIIMLIGMIAMAILALQGKPIPPQIQSPVMICIGAFIARIEKKL